MGLPKAMPINWGVYIGCQGMRHKKWQLAVPWSVVRRYSTIYSVWDFMFTHPNRFANSVQNSLRIPEPRNEPMGRSGRTGVDGVEVGIPTNPTLIR